MMQRVRYLLCSPVKPAVEDNTNQSTRRVIQNFNIYDLHFIVIFMSMYIIIVIVIVIIIMIIAAVTAS